MGTSAGEWCVIESDPGVFTSLIKDFGVQGVEVEEICTLEKESFESLKPVHGLIFLFKYVNDQGQPDGTLIDDAMNTKVFFARQVINNACATQAIISILLNTKHEDLTLGGTLQDFKDFTQSFDSNMKGLALSNSDLIREVHNSFSRQQIVEYDGSSEKSEEAYHFIGYVPIDGKLYELDGLKSGPIDHGAFKGDWLDAARPVIQKRISKYASGEIHFNLLAIVTDRQMMYEKQLEKLNELVESSMDTGDDSGSSNPLEEEMKDLRLKIERETQKKRKYKQENLRRKHNYFPFIVEMLRVLAKEGKLVPLIEEAKSKQSSNKA